MSLIARRSFLAATLAAPGLLAARSAFAQQPGYYAAPIALEGNRVWLGVSVEGLPAVPFILDTGAGESKISDEWATEQKLRERGASVIRGMGGVERTSVLRVEDVVIGNVFRIPFMEFHGTRSIDDNRFRGLISVGLMTSMDSDIDFAKSEWRIYPDGRKDRSGLHQIPDGFLPRGHIYFLSTPVQLGDFSGRFALDTGAPRNIMFDGKASKKLGWWDSDRPYAPQSAHGFGKGSLPTRIYRADKVRLHKFAFPSALVTLAQPGPANGNFDDIDGFVGIHMIRHFHLSTDTKGKQLWMAPNGLTLPPVERYPFSGLWFDRKGDRIFVADVGNGSPAKLAGLQIGDEIFGWNWGELLGASNGPAGRDMAIDYERSGKRARAEFKLQPYL